MILKTALPATVLMAAAASAQEAPEPVPTVSILKIEEERKEEERKEDDDRRWISVDLDCENCESVPEDQCFDVIIKSPEGLQLRTHRKALAHGFVFTAFSDAVRIELVEHEGHPLGKRPTRKHRRDGCVAGPELVFGEPLEFALQDGPHEPE
ncbi:MAG: hypothetical protein OXU63_16465 [Acidobacteriota bacterium]|nr:hypothetical protein [Acidobacteriota bacterium]